MSMSAHNPRLQFVKGLPDSPKLEAKGVFRVTRPWDEVPGSLGLPFDINRTKYFPGVHEGRF